MRRSVNFRFTPQTIHSLNHTSEMLHTSKTQVVEAAIKAYEIKACKKQSSKLAAFSGCISDDIADVMLNSLNDKNTKL
tara:strand:- start:2954 stop:3187 length:234 start_codon:yes stop_codon:yes gene_type:complete